MSWTNREDYDRYLRSPEWAAKRAAVLLRDVGRCQNDGCSRRAADVHHITYVHLGEERLYELVSLCRECHESDHRERRHGRVTLRPPERFEAVHALSRVRAATLDERERLEADARAALESNPTDPAVGAWARKTLAALSAFDDARRE